MLTNDHIEPVVFTVDYSQVEKGTQKANEIVDKYRAGSILAAAQINESLRKQGEEVDRLAEKHHSLIVRAASWMDPFSVSVKTIGRALDDVGHGIEKVGSGIEKAGSGALHAAEGVAKFALALGVAAKAIEHQKTAVDVFDAITERVRTARVAIAGLSEGIGGAAAVGAEIGLVVALERSFESAYARGKDLQRQAVEMQKTGLDYSTIVERDFAAGRAGIAPSILTAAIKASGGIDEFTAKLKQLADVQDPLDRVRQTWAAFGDDAEKILPLIGKAGDRFADNVQRAREYGLELDAVSREHVDVFKRDVDSLGGAFAGLGDSMKAWGQGIGVYFAEVAGAAWASLREWPSAFAEALPHVPLAFSTDSLDTESAARAKMRGAVDDVTAQQAMALRDRLAGPGSKLFLATVDREAQLKSQIEAAEKSLFVTDTTRPDYGKILPGAQYPGGYVAESEALQRYVSNKSELSAIDAEKQRKADADKEQQQQEAERKRNLEQIDRIQSSLTVKESLLPKSAEMSSVLDKLSGQYLTQAVSDAMGVLKDESRDVGKNLNDEFLKIARRSTRGDDENLWANEIKEGLAANKEPIANILRVAEGIRESSITADRAGMAFGEERETGAAKLAEIGADTPQAKLQSELQLLDIKKKYAEEAFEYDLKLAQEKHLNDGQLENVTKDLRIEYAKEVYAVEQQQAGAIAEEYKRQLKEIESKADSLFHTLLTKPSKFPKQLQSTLHEAIVQPVAQGLGRLTAQTIQPLVYGSDGKSGIAGLFRTTTGENDVNIPAGFGSKNFGSSAAPDASVEGVLKAFGAGGEQNPLKISTDVNSTVTAQNSEAVMGLTAVLASAAGTTAPTVSLSGGIGGAIAPPVSAPAVSSHIRDAASAEPGSSAAYSVPSLIRIAGEGAAAMPWTGGPSSVRYVGTGGVPSVTSSISFGDEYSGGGYSPSSATSPSSTGEDYSSWARRTYGGDKWSRVLAGIPASLPSSTGENYSSWSRRAYGDNGEKWARTLAGVPTSVAPSSTSGFSGAGSTPSVSSTISFGEEASPAENSSDWSPVPGAIGLGWSDGGPVPLGGTSSSSSATPLGVPFGGARGVSASIEHMALGAAAGKTSGLPTLTSLSKMGSNLSQMVGYQGNGIWKLNGLGQPGAAIGPGGIAQSVASSPAAGMAGMMLTESGLMGNQRGTWGGIAESTAGGALLGASIGSMFPVVGTAIGAAAGAAAGFAVGGIEKLAGIISPQTKAKQDVKSIYHISISDATANQIASIAQSQFGGNVELAVRSPQVRKMLAIYAAGTGQNGFPQSAATPEAGSLVEQGGKLYQQATYQFGKPYVFQSNLPVTPGSAGATTLPNPSGPTYISVNVGDQGAASYFNGQITSAVTADYVQNAYSAAQNSSNGRLDNSAMIQQPGLITS